MAEKEAKAGSGKGKGKLIIIMVVVLLLLGAGGGAAWWFLLRPKAGPAKLQAASHKPRDAHFITLKPFVTNVISQDDSTHYLQVKIDLKTFDTKTDSEVTSMTPEIRNAVLRILAAQHASTVTTVLVREDLRAQILVAINRVLNGDGGSGVPTPPAPPASMSSQARAAQLDAAARLSAAKGPIAGVFFTGFVVQ